jgi:preprotein translocase subunit SecE
MKTEEKTENPMITYFKGVRAEWGKISWPQKPQIITETLMVIGVTVFFTIVVYLLDLTFKFLLGLIK